MRPPSPSRKVQAAIAAGALTVVAATLAVSPQGPAAAAPQAASKPTGLLIRSAGAAAAGSNAEGLPDGAVKHVWLIIEENKSYDATFTGLNKNSYLWQTLPQQGVLLKNYFGTGHFSQDNYESLVAAQAPEQDTQSDCDKTASNFGTNATIEANGPVTSNVDYGQVVSTAGANAADGKNGCVYPSQAPTLFNQLDAAGKTWKGYAQDLGDQAGRDDGPCGYPGTSTNTPTANTDPAAATGSTAAHSDSTPLNGPQYYPGVRSFTGVQSAGNDAASNAGAKEDGYVAKHFPFPWFHSLIDGTTTPANGGSDCDNNHIANLDGPVAGSKWTGSGLYSDLQSETTTPNFSWITPNNCSDAHDAVCKGNNLSGAFNADGTPNYATGGSKPYDPQGTTPKNYTGGLYASDLFLKWYIPLIEQSPAFKDGGLIDVTFDEGNPPFANSSFNNANDPTFATSSTGGVSDAPTANTYLAADAAGQTINGAAQNSEPTGPNQPNTVSGTCTALPCPGPGDNGFIDRTPSGARNDGVQPAATPPVAGTALVSASSGSSVIVDNNILATDPNRTVTDTVDTTGPGGTSPIPANSFVGPASDVGPVTVTQSVTSTGGGLSPAASVVAGSFTLVDANGNPVAVTGKVTGLTLGARSVSTDPLYDATDFTPGGGDTGSVLISPYITPGTSSTIFYNHYSWLRTMEDLFDVNKGTSTGALPAGSVSAGVDGLGHLGYAAQPGLAPFGPDVFSNPPAPAGTTAPVPAPVTPLPAPLGIPTLTGIGAVGTVETCGAPSFTGSPVISYQWIRDATPIALASNSTYMLTVADFGHVVYCRVAATNAGGSIQVLSPGFQPLAGPRLIITKPEVIVGAFRVGSHQQAKGVAVSSTTPLASISYQWLRAGKNIAGAIGSYYSATTADRGKLLSCRVTLLSPGLTTTTATSKAGTVR